MLARILFQRENELFDEISAEKNLFRKLMKAVELNAIATAFKESMI